MFASWHFCFFRFSVNSSFHSRRSRKRFPAACLFSSFFLGLTPLPPSPPMACESNSTVSSARGCPSLLLPGSGLPRWPPTVKGASPSSSPATPSKEVTVEVLPHANGGVGGFVFLGFGDHRVGFLALDHECRHFVNLLDSKNFMNPAGAM